MQIHDLIQGSDAWHEFRLTHRGASEAAAMLGISKKVKRTELLHMKHTGNAKEFSDWVQENILDYGHEVEALARPIVESAMADDLYPVTCSEGLLSASCDGLTMSERDGWEHKQWNAVLAAAVAAQELPDEFMAQPQQCLLVTGADRWTFTVSDGTEENMVSMEILPDPVWFDRIRAGWAQFAIDLAAYVPAEVVAQAVGHTPESLPALRIEVTGMVTASNLAQYKEHALAVFAGINKVLKTDQDFADADKIVKWCGDVEDRLVAAKQHALSQTESIDALFRTIDDISAEARRTRLELDKLVTARKLQVRTEIQQEGVAAMAEHIAALNARLGKPYMPVVPVDFAGAMKGKRSIDSIRDAVNTTLANAKIAASATADKIHANLTTLRELASAHAFLFADAAQIVLKAPEDLTMLVKSRIADHTATEEKKAEELRASIRKEEQEKAEKVVSDAKEAEDALVLSFERASRRIEFDSVPYIEKASRTYESTGGDWENDMRPHVVAAFLAGRAYLKERLDTANQRTAEAATAIAPVPAAQPSPAAPAITHEDVVNVMMPPAVRQAMAPSVKPTTPPTMALGEISAKLGFNVTSVFLASLGFDATTVKAAKLFHEADFPAICRALIEHIESVCELQAA